MKHKPKQLAITVWQENNLKTIDALGCDVDAETSLGVGG